MTLPPHAAAPEGSRARPGASPPGTRRLIVNADDFGRTAEINTAVTRAHQEGVLTTASLMVNEPGFAGAVAAARDNPRLGVGLHLTLLCGHAALPPTRLPGLVDAGGRFSDSPVSAGCRYFFQRKLRALLRDEMAAQFEKFHATGLRLDHVNGHLHLHLHPVVFRILMEHAAEWGVTHVRLTRDPFWLNARLVSGRWLYRGSHALIYRWLSGAAAGELARRNLRHTPRVFGLLQDGHVDEAYVLRLLQALPAGDAELYAHPCPGAFRHELEALISPRVRTCVQELGVELIRYQDL
jgi:hopanoid biosynthesis associated protein HpnK